MVGSKILDTFPYPSHYINIYDSKMHYIEQGSGDPILFLHGIPTSSYLWRNIIPHLAPLGRCIALDLIGLGKSQKPNIEYSISDHIKYVEKFIETLNLTNLTLVMHDWGSIIGFDYSMRHEKNCKGLVFYEAYLRPFSDSDISLPYQEQRIALQSQDNIYELVMNGTYFVDKILPQSTLHNLTDEEMYNYREPFLDAGSGKALCQYLKELPKGDNNGNVDKIIQQYSEKLTHSKLPKLMLYSVPGFITSMATAMWAKENLPNLEIVDVGEDLHYAQESHPEIMGETISVWLQGIDQNVYV